MTKSSVLQESFSAGEISPLTQARYSSEGYRSGCKQLRNMHPDSRGPARGRAGSKYLNEVTGKTTGRSFNFQVDPDTYFTLVVTDADLDAFKNDGSAPQNFTTPWTAAQLTAIQTETTPDGLTIYFFHPNVSPRKLVYTPGTGLFAFSTVSFTSTPSEWTGTNYPGAGTFFQGRLWLGGTPAEPTTFWGSKSGLFEDFTIGVADDDAFSVEIAKSGQILWMLGTKNLLLGTENAEHIVTAEAGILTPSDHTVTQQSAYGSKRIQAEQVGDQLFYVSPDGIKVRAMQYEWTEDNWLSVNLAYFSEHITESGIEQIAWQQNPNNRFWCVLANGTLAELSYDRSNNIYGLSAHNYGEQDSATIVDIAVGIKNGVSEIVLLVERNGADLYLEVEPSDESFYMDSWYKKTGSGFTNFDGLDHLEGEEIQILADGAVVANKTVSSGAVTLDDPVDEAVGGLRYDPTLQLLPLEQGSPIGPSPPFWKNYYRIDIHLIDSAHPLINGTRVPTVNPADMMDEPATLANGKSFVRLTDWGNETDVTVTQDLPLPITITAASGMVEQNVL